MSTQTALDHVLEVVLNLKPGSPLHRALEYNAYTCPEDLLMETDDNLNDLKYPDDKGKKLPLEKGYASLLRIFKQFAAYQSSQGVVITKDDDWKAFTKEQFNAFRFANANTPTPFAATVNPIPASQPLLSTVQPPSSMDLVRDFKQGIKRNVSQFPVLKDEANWDNWN